MKEQLTLFQEDSLANPSASLESGKARMMNAIFGTKCFEQFKRLSPNSSLPKTSMVSSILTGDWYSSKCALTWKLKGTKCNRLLFQLAPKTHRTEETGFGLLPTVKTFDATGQRKLDENGKNISKTSGQSYGVHLTQMAESGLLPTPSANEGYKSTGTENQDSITKRLRQAGGSPSQLSPHFVGEMMGFPKDWTVLPFLSGEESPSKLTETQ